MLLQDNCNSIINTLTPSTQHPSLPQAIPPPLFVSTGHEFKSLTTPFPLLYFTSLWLFCNYLFVLPNLRPLQPFSHTPTHLATLKTLSMFCYTLHIHDSVSGLLGCLVCFLDSTVDSYVFIAILLFIVFIFFFFWNPVKISYNNNLMMMNSFSVFLSGKLFICSSILCDSFAKAILAIGPYFSWLQIFLAHPFYPAKFLLRNQLTVLWELPCR